MGLSYGTATLDFGAAPGKCDAKVVVTGVTGMGPASYIYRSWIVWEATPEHTVEEVQVISSEQLTVGIYDVIPGTGFTIRGLSRRGTLRGRFTVGWKLT